MNALLLVFWRIAILKEGPQDLPRSGFLLGIALFFDWSVSVVAGGLQGQLSLAMLEAFLAVVLQALVLGFLLLLSRHLDRFSQSLTALVGTDGLISLFALPVLGVSTVLPDTVATTSWLILGFMLWSITVQAHILRNALSIRMSLALALAMAYTLGSIRLFGLFMQSSP